jgi:hypothetical protein
MSRPSRGDWESEEDKKHDERNRQALREYIESRHMPIEPEPFDPDGPPVFEIKSRDWWVKVLGMLSHNWALIEKTNTGATVYFFHDAGTTKGFDGRYKLRQLDNRVAVVDSLDFESAEKAEDALMRNDFDLLAEKPGPWLGMQPEGNYYDARATEPGVYSKGEYWED